MSLSIEKDTQPVVCRWTIVYLPCNKILYPPPIEKFKMLKMNTPHRMLLKFTLIRTGQYNLDYMMNNMIGQDSCINQHKHLTIFLAILHSSINGGHTRCQCGPGFKLSKHTQPTKPNLHLLFGVVAMGLAQMKQLNPKPTHLLIRWRLSTRTLHNSQVQFS